MTDTYSYNPHTADSVAAAFAAGVGGGAAWYGTHYKPDTGIGIAEQGASSWKDAAGEHLHTSFYGAENVRKSRAYFVGVKRGIRLLVSGQQALTTQRNVRAFEGKWMDEGYEFIGVGADNGWQAIAGWGVDGWDLLDWPYYIVLFRGDTERAIYCEGDITLETFLNKAAREASTDVLALWHWTKEEEPWAVGPNARPAADLRGPYRPKKAEATS